MTGDAPDGRGLPGCGDLVAGDRIAGSRSRQEDDFGMTGFGGRDPGGCDLLLVLADGMGGHRGGAEASRLAVSAGVETFRRTAGGAAARLRAALDAANAAVGRRAAETRYAHMGCTLVACAVTRDGAAHWISVGDSPLWRLRDGGHGGMDRLNADHSMRPVLEGLVRTGRLAADEVDEGSSHQLRSALTGEELTLVDEGADPVRLELGDLLVLASDGLETLSGEEICRSGGNPAAADVVSDLLAAVEAAGATAQDNATAVVYRHAGASAIRRRFERLTARTRPVARRA